MCQVLVCSSDHDASTTLAHTLTEAGVHGVGTTHLEGRAALRLVAHLRPTLLLLDARSMADSLSAFVHAVRVRYPSTRMLMLVPQCRADVPSAIDAILAGADDVLELPDDDTALDATFVASTLLPTVLALLIPPAPPAEGTESEMSSLADDRAHHGTTASRPLITVVLAPTSSLAPLAAQLRMLPLTSAPLLIWSSLPLLWSRALAEQLTRQTGRLVQDPTNLSTLGVGAVALMSIDSQVVLHESGADGCCLTLAQVDAHYAPPNRQSARLQLATPADGTRVRIALLGAPSARQLPSVLALKDRGAVVTRFEASAHTTLPYADYVRSPEELALTLADAPAWLPGNTARRDRYSVGVQP